MTRIIFVSLAICIFLLFYYILKSLIKEYKKKLVSLLLIIIVLWLIVEIILYPQNSVNAALNGLMTWFNIVVPSLLPFFIVSEILIGLGVVRFLGILLQPLMKPLFNVPGEGSFALAMSITSGYPIGAKLVSKLRSQNVITRIESQRLLSFCSTSGPLFMIGSISIGMFKNPSIGPLIALSHYLGAIMVGFFFRFYGKNEKKTYTTNRRISIKFAFNELIKARDKDGRTFSMLMSDAVKESINTMLMIGGFIIIYSVIIEILSLVNVLDYFSSIVTKIIPLIKDEELIKAILSGIVEMTNGCKIVSTLNNSDYILRLASISLIIGWSGISIHSQVMSFISNTDIVAKIYFVSKALHGIFASIFTYILYNLVFKEYINTSALLLKNTELDFQSSWLYIFKFSSQILAIIILTILSIALLTGLLSGIKKKL